MDAKEVTLLLQQELAGLLGFDDGAGDVLAHLLTIASSEDLLDYLSQLLGTPNDSIRLFVEHVDQFKKGALRGKDFPTTTASSSSHQGEGQHVQTHVPPAVKQLEQSRAPPCRDIVTPAVPLQPARPSAGNPPSKAGTNESSLRATAAAHHPSRTNTQKAKKTATTTTTRTTSTHQKQQQPHKSVPKRGKTSVVCGCFGTQHKVLANCLCCGRISCQREGYDFCPFCGILVEAPPPNGGGEAGSGSDAAWRHKERLLRFDRESVQRMVVMDDQADTAAAAGNSMAWLTEGERSEAHERQAEQDRSLSQRPKIKLDILL